MFRAAVIAMMALVGLVWLSMMIDSRPALLATQELPRDVRALTNATWAGFIEAFPGQRSCLTDVRLTLVDDVSNGAARYRADQALIEIEIPTSPARYPESLAHELGHHLEAACDVERTIGGEFRDAQGFATGDPWNGGGRWQERPTEQFAETVVLIVLGERLTHSDLFDIAPEAVDVVVRWARTDEESS